MKPLAGAFSLCRFDPDLVIGLDPVPIEETVLPTRQIESTTGDTEGARVETVADKPYKPLILWSFIDWPDSFRARQQRYQSYSTPWFIIDESELLSGHTTVCCPKIIPKKRSYPRQAQLDSFSLAVHCLLSQRLVPSIQRILK